MVPETVGALLAFLGLIAPGLLYEMRRERSRARIVETAFREASRVALVSFGLTATSLAVLGVVHEWQPDWLPDVGRFVREGARYWAARHRLILRAGALEVGFACLLALAMDRVVRRFAKAQGEVTKASVWVDALRTQRPAGHVPWIHVHLKSGTDVWGYVLSYTVDQPLEDREIAIFGQGLQFRLGPAGAVVRPGEDGWQTIVVPGREIEYFKVQYRPERP